MKFYNDKNPLYLQIDTFEVRIRASLQQLRNGMNCPLNKAPDHIILRQTAFTCKSLSRVERRHSNIKRGIKDTTMIREVSSLLLHKGGKYNYWEQATCSYFQEGLSKAMTKATMHIPENFPVQNQGYLQTWVRPLHS